ncbi:hypothetical protein [Paracidovorax wautersii]|uniref:Uncharacterized protein n=1 Tax=Paracidovorax wautersii TaxID=1177982 RepID=A0ABU1IGU5_9BURK|nr:hypothetical protein [Paracidovorax wautersii]MDR6216186.1 hypothetical protein [Paracidovorax wautersii]
MGQEQPKRMDAFRLVSFEGPAPVLREKLSAVNGYVVVDGHHASKHYKNAIQLQTPSGDVINLDFRDEGALAVVTHVFGQDSGPSPAVADDESVKFANAVRQQYPDGEIEDIVEMSNADRGIRSA